MATYNDAVAAKKKVAPVNRFAEFGAWKEEIRRVLRIDVGLSASTIDRKMVKAHDWKILFLNGLSPRDLVNRQFGPDFFSEDE